MCRCASSFLFFIIYLFILSVILFICTTLQIFNHPRHPGDELVEIRQSVNHPVDGIVMQKVPIPAWESIQSVESLVRSIQQQQNSHLDPYHHHPHHITPHHTAPHHTIPRSHHTDTTTTEIPHHTAPTPTHTHTHTHTHVPCTTPP